MRVYAQVRSETEIKIILEFPLDTKNPKSVLESLKYHFEGNEIYQSLIDRCPESTSNPVVSTTVDLSGLSARDFVKRLKEIQELLTTLEQLLEQLFAKEPVVAKETPMFLVKGGRAYMLEVVEEVDDEGFQLFSRTLNQLEVHLANERVAAYERLARLLERVIPMITDEGDQVPQLPHWFNHKLVSEGYISFRDDDALVIARKFVYNPRFIYHGGHLYKIKSEMPQIPCLMCVCYRSDTNRSVIVLDERSMERLSHYHSLSLNDCIGEIVIPPLSQLNESSLRNLFDALIYNIQIINRDSLGWDRIDDRLPPVGSIEYEEEVSRAWGG